MLYSGEIEIRLIEIFYASIVELKHIFKLWKEKKVFIYN